MLRCRRTPLPSRLARTVGRAVAVALAAGGALAGGAPLARGQEPPAAAAQPPASVVLPTTGVEVVRIEVVVSEKHGRPRTGLRRADFVVLEDGKPQPIVQFQAFARPELSGPAKAAPAPAPQATEEALASDEMLPARYVVLAIDDVHMEFESLARVRKALERFLEQDLRPEDQVALVTTSGASALSQEFTSDRGVLRQTLSRLSAQGRRAEWTGVPHISEYQAEMIEAGDPMALEAGIEEVIQSGMFQDAATAEEEVRRKARTVLTEAVFNARLTMESLERLCRGLSGLSGRKTLFLVSDGFVTGLAAGSGSSFDMRRIADAATRAGVVVYSLDTRGLVAVPPGARADSPLKIGPATGFSIEAMRRRSEEAMRVAMNAIAVDTGGFLVEGSNDLRVGLRAMLKDTETYYVLAYEPTNTKRDGAFRRIEVRLPGVEGVKVRSRSGYFAPDDRRALRGATAEDAARREEQRRAEMGTALEALAPLSGIPVRLTTDFISRDGSSGEVVVNGSVDVGALPFVRRDDRLQATVETAAVVLDETGQLVATLETERRTLDLSPADHAKLVPRGLPYTRAIALKPGRYQVRLATRDDATGLLGSAWHRVEVPDLAKGRFTLSGLFLLKDAGSGASPGGGPAAAGGPSAERAAEQALRSAQDLPHFARAERLYVQFQAYNAKRDAAGAIDVVCQAAVLRGGTVLATAAPEPLEAAEAGTPVAHLSRIGLRSLEPGEYELRMTVTDRRANAVATRVASFTVE